MDSPFIRRLAFPFATKSIETSYVLFPTTIVFGSPSETLATLAESKSSILRPFPTVFDTSEIKNFLPNISMSVFSKFGNICPVVSVVPPSAASVKVSV